MLIFGSSSIRMHLLRGVIGLGALLGASLVSGSYPWIWVVAIPITLLAFRGCPMCWTAGLLETVTAGRPGGPARGSAAFMQGPADAPPGAAGVSSGEHCARCGDTASWQAPDHPDGGPA